MIDKDKKIGYVRITSFIQNTAEDLKKALGKLKEQGMRGLILDLRDDPGGLLSAAVEVSDLFLSDGEIVSTKGRNTQPKTFSAQKDSPFEDVPMVVLVNQNSASASEIVSAAPAGPSPRHRRRPAVVRQGLGPEHLRAGGRQQRAQAHRGQLLSPLGREHPSLQERQADRQVGRLAGQGMRGEARPRRVSRLVPRPPGPRPRRRPPADTRRGACTGEGQGRRPRRSRRRPRPRPRRKRRKPGRSVRPHGMPTGRSWTSSSTRPSR